jgi:hypothetical protein
VTTLRAQILDDAIELVRAMTAFGLRYQWHLSHHDFPDNLAIRLELADECNDRFRVRPGFIALRLQIAGYDAAAESLRSFAALVRRFSFLTISWDVDADISLLDDDVDSAGDHLLGLLEVERHAKSSATTSPGQPLVEARLAILVAAGELIANLGECSDDYFFYFEGLRDAHEPEEKEISNEQRMLEVKEMYEKLAIREVVERCAASGYPDVASSIEELSFAVSAVANLPLNAFPSQTEDKPWISRELLPDGLEVDVKEMSGAVVARYREATERLMQASHPRDRQTGLSG